MPFSHAVHFGKRGPVVVVLLSLAGSSLLALALSPLLERDARILPFTLGVLVASTYGGLAAGLVTTILGFVIADFFFTEPIFRVLSQPSDFAVLVVFLIFGFTTSFLNHALSRVTSRLRETNQRVELASTAANVGFHEWIAAENRVISTPQMARMLGDQSGSLVCSYDDWMSRIHPEDRERLRQSTANAVSSGRTEFSAEYRVVAPDGGVRYIEARYRLFFDEDGAFRRAVAANIDITQRKMMEQALSERSRELARSNEELERFAYAVAHDLNEPLRGIRSFTELVLRRHREQIPPDGIQSLEVVLSAADRMRGLIRNLLEYATVSRDAAPPSRVDTAAAVRTAIQNLEAKVAESGATVTCDSLPSITAHEAQLVVLFQNLISNALKYRGEAAPCEVHISAVPEGSDWLFSVRDNGIGIAPQHHQKIFEPFARLHSSSAYEGSGVGLATCKRIVQIYGGRIWVNSEPGKGSTFFFTLPAGA
jgi:signal transduction histidine kinase